MTVVALMVPVLLQFDGRAGPEEDRAEASAGHSTSVPAPAGAPRLAGDLFRDATAADSWANCAAISSAILRCRSSMICGVDGGGKGVVGPITLGSDEWYCR